MEGTTEKEYAAMVKGSTASKILNELTPFIDSINDDVVNRMKGLFREGKANQENLTSAVAQLVCLEDLGNKLQSAVKMGNKTREKNT